jgi:hypothetical protein
MFQFVVCFILPIRIIKQLKLLACSNALRVFTDFPAQPFWINYVIHLHLRVKYFSALNAFKVFDTASRSNPL